MSNLDYIESLYSPGIVDSNETHESIKSCQLYSQSLQYFPSSQAPALKDRHDLKSNPIPQSDLGRLHDINDSNEQYIVDTATFTFPVDIIPVTRTGSSIFEGLSQYNSWSDFTGQS